MDRNSELREQANPETVALLAEGVDRNLAWDAHAAHGDTSPSSRRAWIEIVHQMIESPIQEVALLAEGVDRNRFSPVLTGKTVRVALLAEGVDRNLCVLRLAQAVAGRPPRGGRG